MSDALKCPMCGGGQMATEFRSTAGYEIVRRGVDKSFEPGQDRRRIGRIGDSDERTAQRQRALRLDHAAQPIELAMFEHGNPPAGQREGGQRAFAYRIRRRHGARCLWRDDEGAGR